MKASKLFGKSPIDLSNRADKKASPPCPVKHPCSHLTDCSHIQRKSFPPKAAPKEQRIIDFGQRSLGLKVECPTCSMLYCKGDPEDEAAHLKACDPWSKGVPIPVSWDKERAKATFADGGRIIEIRPNSPVNHLAKVSVMLFNTCSSTCNPASATTRPRRCMRLWPRSSAAHALCSRVREPTYLYARDESWAALLLTRQLYAFDRNPRT